MDQPLEAATTAESNEKALLQIKFQSFLSWINLLKNYRYSGEDTAANEDVSILLIVDQPLEAGYGGHGTSRISVVVFQSFLSWINLLKLRHYEGR